MARKGKPPAALSPDQKKEIVEMAVEAGIKAYRSEAEKHKREVRDRRLRNTRLLMKNYRDLKEHTEKAVFEAATVKDDSLEEILSLMSEFTRDEASSIDSIKESAAKTKLMMDHVDEMLRIYEASCERSKKPEDLRKFHVLYDLYISPDDLTLDEIARKYNVEERTAYRDLKDAISRLTALIFGVEGIFQ